MWWSFMREMRLKTYEPRMSGNTRKKGYFLLECIIGLMLVAIVMGFVFTISVGLSHECKQINESVGAAYGLSSICDAFEEDMLHAGPLKIIRATGQEIVMHTAFDTITWHLCPTGLRRACGQSEQSGVRKTLISRDIAAMTLNSVTGGYEFEVHDTKGNQMKRYIEVIT